MKALVIFLSFALFAEARPENKGSGGVEGHAKPSATHCQRKVRCGSGDKLPRHSRYQARPASPFFLARITVYWSKPFGSDRWTERRQSATGTRLVDGKHCAVDPKVIPYGSRLRVAGLLLTAVDTGGAVKRRTASRGKAPVVDVYFYDRAAALRWDAKTPDYLRVEVL